MSTIPSWRLKQEFTKTIFYFLPLSFCMENAMKTRNACLTAAVFLAALSAVSGAAQAELVGYWTFNGNANDSSTYTNNGTASNVSYTTDLPTELAGHASQSASFNGSSSDVIVPYTSSLYCNSAVTIAFWMKALNTDQSNNFRRAFSNIAGGAYGFEFQQDIGSTNMQVRIDTNSTDSEGKANGINQCKNIGTAFDGNWHHIAITADSTGTLTTYFDGLGTAQSFLFGTTFGSTANIRFGNSMNEPSDWLKGSMADAAMWNNVLTGNQIAALADGSATPLTIPEPCSFVLLSAAFAGLLAYAWRKQK